MLSIRSSIDYDKKFDVLYYNILETDNSYGDEIDNTIVLLRDMEDDSIITGITILDFKKNFIHNQKKKQVLSEYIDITPIVNFI